MADPGPAYPPDYRDPEWDGHREAITAALAEDARAGERDARFEYTTFPVKSLASMTVEQLLNIRARDGWRFVAFDGSNYIFERPKET
jgi:hypothetical protein